MRKRGKEISQTSSKKDTDMSSLFSDTVCNKDCGSSSWEAMYKLFEDEGPRVIDKVSATCTNSTSDATLFGVACSYIHWIAATPKILPYTDMVKWAIDHLNIEDRIFKNSRGEIMGSFKAEDLAAMYHLPTPQQRYNNKYV